MRKFSVLGLLAVALLLATLADASAFGRRGRCSGGGCSSGNCGQSAGQYAVPYTCPLTGCGSVSGYPTRFTAPWCPTCPCPTGACPSACPATGCPNGVCPTERPRVPANVAPPAAGGSPILFTAPAGEGVGEAALAEVNAKRAARGLRPFRHDPCLSAGALACAQFRAARRLFGHTPNDFAFLPPGCTAASGGCAAYHASYGWMSCCTYDGNQFAGAAYVTGADGKRYMHLFVR